MEKSDLTVKFDWVRPHQVRLFKRESAPEVFKAYETASGYDSLRAWEREHVLVGANLGASWEPISPLEDPKILDHFSKLEFQESDIVRLAQQYGLLTACRGRGLPQTGQVLSIDGQQLVVEPLGPWLQLMPYVYTHATTALAAQQNGAERLSKIEIMHLWPGALREGWILCNGLPQSEYSSTVEARRFLNFLLETPFSGPNVNLEMKISESSNQGYQLVLRPTNLYYAIHTQLILAISGKGLGIHQCAQCDDVFTAAGHRDIMYCSRACRQAASRERLSAGATMVQQLTQEGGVIARKKPKIQTV